MPAPAALLVALVAASSPRLVDVADRIPDASVELRYAGTENLLGRPIYPPGARCLLLPAVADRLAHAADRLRQQGFRLLVYDCYRPLGAQRALWAAAPIRGWVADPDHGGSHHNRAAAVDVGLAGRDGAELPLPTPFDAIGDPHARAFAHGVPAAARRNRDRLRTAMEAEGFRVNPYEWWHFDAPEAKGAPLLDLPLVRKPRAGAGAPR